MTWNDFTWSEYRELLRLLRQGRENLLFGELEHSPLPKRFFLLRHDIDLDPAAALNMARLEAAEGTRATYFFLVGCPCYNLLSQQWCEVPRQIVELGHEVGLHYDVEPLMARVSSGPQTALDQEAQILGWLSGRPIRSIAMHNPSISGTDPFAGRENYVNAYDPRWCKDIKYFSDSCGAWRDETFDALRSGRLPGRLQFLVHPLFWNHQPADRWTRLKSWFHTRCADLEGLTRKITDGWAAHAGVKQHQERLGLS